MLDAFIIDRIRRERERREGSRIPLRVELPVPQPPRPSGERDRVPEDPDDPERGTALIEDSF
jgi:hypothetical protein